jgi:hypothetical protein
MYLILILGENNMKNKSGQSQINFKQYKISKEVLNKLLKHQFN